MKYGKRAELGFTMVELIVVIVLIGILSTVAAARFSTTKQFDVSTLAQEVKSLAQFGQKLAIAQNRAVYISANTSRIALCYDAACAQRVTDPAGGNSNRTATVTACADAAWVCEGVPSGLAVVAAPSSSMFFNAVGRPFAGGDAPTTDTSTFATLTITVNGGDSSQVVTIECETGYVH